MTGSHPTPSKKRDSTPGKAYGSGHDEELSKLSGDDEFSLSGEEFDKSITEEVTAEADPGYFSSVDVPLVRSWV